MGEVWRATDTSLGRPVAVKVLKSEYADDPLFRSRFETEARHAASLHHPGVAVGLRRRASPRCSARADGSGAAAAVPRDGAGRRPAALGAAARRPAARPRRGPRPDGPGRRRDRRRAPGRHRAPRREAGQPARHARPAGQDHRLRHRPRLRRPRPHRHRPGDGHAAVPLARAGPRRHRDAGLRRLLARRRGLRVPGRAPARSTPTPRSRPRWPTSTTRSRTCRPRSPPTWPPSYAGRWPRTRQQRFADGDAFAAALRDPAAAAATAYVAAARPAAAEQHPGACAACRRRSTRRRPPPAPRPSDERRSRVAGRAAGARRWWPRSS